ncbi:MULTISPECIES: ABC transporter substrate-binding protein [Enterococcus]|uniref:ABC transporter substrate-binding protein n=1 Tax=Enterococcus TaxID=1350 RepID=UPI001904909E|nr:MULTISPECIES: ABC transporter substrate-binding protein [Enterococcus]MBK0038204.1 ABC transporter substrate-binding protein [Enterococcus sp. S52]MBK0070548.1 ABC transporter substrate-binding protein [Enterococcus sp. S53]MBK0140665.1 ABC transporter substrate-binding protein [Enterococcus sp. S76]MBK0145179.1 ABC transporter substrate-binding protein [Enterococcus sp. S77]MEB8398618.1 ABC transporter substrate-binding protein [Enterococcus casseliflavus]
MRKLFYMGTLLFSVGVLAAGCGNSETADSSGNESADGKTTLDFWSFWGSGARQEVIEEIIDDFNASQDKIEVKYSYQPWGDIWTKSLSSITAGNPPDVIVQDINSVAQRAEAQQATNLSEYIEEGFSDEFYPQLWDTVEYEGDAYAVPFNTDTQVIFYNKTLFKEAGISEEQLPQTWEELETVARKLDVKNGDDFERIGFYPLWNLGADVWALNADDGVSWFDKDENVKIDTDNKVEALEWILDWQEYYGQDTINRLEAEFGSGVADPFISGLVAMRAQNINYYSSLAENAPDDFEFGVIQIPEKESGSGHWSWGGGFVLEVPYGAKDPEASYEFIKYLSTPEVQEKFGEKSFDIMANRTANENLVNNDNLDENGQMIYQMADENFAHTVITPVPLTAPDFSSLVNEQIDQIMLGSKTPAEGLADAQKAVEDLVEQNK